MSEYRSFFVEWIEEWSEQFPRRKYNWRTFHVAMFEIEDDKVMGGVEATIIILGLGFRARWNYAETEKVKEVTDSVAEIKAVLGEES